MSTLSTRQTIGLVVLFALTSISFIALDNRSALDPLKTALHDLIVPVTDVFNRVGDGNDSDLAQELERVKAERDAAIARNVQLEAQLKDVEQLQAILGVKKAHTEWSLVTARVIGVDPLNLQKYVVIDKGSADGIREGMAVIDPNYFVGQVIGPVGEHSAKVLLTIDASSTIGAELSSSGADGIVYGRWQTGGRLQMAYVDRDVQPKAGELVVTSTSAETRTVGVPGNLIIGIVEDDPERSNQGDSQTINVLPASNFDNLSIVAVIVDDGDTNA